MNAEELRKKVLIERQLEKIRCERSYADFVKSAWHVLEPDTELIWNWHLDYLCDEVEKQLRRIAAKEPREYHLVINVPPRSLKSYIFTRLPTAWAWIHWPSMRFLTASYADDLALEHAVDTRSLIQSEWYQSHWGDKYELMGDQNVKSFYKTDHKGYRMTTTPTGRGTGRGGNIVSVDDPISADEAESPKVRSQRIRWWTRTMRTRINDAMVDMFWVIMQRLHQEDLTGYIMTHQADKYKHICLPAEESEDVRPRELRKTYINGYLFPDRFSPQFLQGIKDDDPYVYAGQYQQRPSPEEGGIFKRQWWKFWRPADMDLPAVTVRVGTDQYQCEVVPLPADFDEVINSWDMTFKDAKTSDYVVGQAWASKNVNRYLLDQYRGKWSFATSLTNVLKMKRAYPRASGVLIEDKANGSAIISEVQKVVPGVLPVKAATSKHSRFMPMSKQAESGNIYLPHPAIAPWVNDLIEEFTSYPNGTNDDQIDAGAHAINHLTSLRRVWPQYRPNLKNYRIRWRDLSAHTTLLCSQWVEPDLTTSIVLGLWNAYDMKLTLFDELVVSTPMAEIVRGALEAKLTRDTAGALTSMSRFEWYGNALMFARKGTAGITVSAPKDGMWEAYGRAGVNLLENVAFDEYGAILLMARLLILRAVRIDARCTETSRQIVSWSVDGTKPAPGHGLCRAVCNMVSVLWETGKMEKHVQKLRPYSKAKERWMEEAERAEKDGRMDDFLQNADAGSISTVINGANNWM